VNQVEVEAGSDTFLSQSDMARASMPAHIPITSSHTATTPATRNLQQPFMSSDAMVIQSPPNTLFAFRIWFEDNFPGHYSIPFHVFMTTTLGCFTVEKLMNNVLNHDCIFWIQLFGADVCDLWRPDLIDAIVVLHFVQTHMQKRTHMTHTSHLQFRSDVHADIINCFPDSVTFAHTQWFSLKPADMGHSGEPFNVTSTRKTQFQKVPDQSGVFARDESDASKSGVQENRSHKDPSVLDSGEKCDAQLHKVPSVLDSGEKHDDTLHLINVSDDESDATPHLINLSDVSHATLHLSDATATDKKNPETSHATLHPTDVCVLDTGEQCIVAEETKSPSPWKFHNFQDVKNGPHDLNAIEIFPFVTEELTVADVFDQNLIRTSFANLCMAAHCPVHLPFWA
jgi:hypothetical protein